MNFLPWGPWGSGVIFFAPRGNLITPGGPSGNLSATALARLACKGVPLPLVFCLWLWCLVIFFEILVLLGGPGFHPWPTRPSAPPTKNPPLAFPKRFFFSSFFGCLFGLIVSRSWLGFSPSLPPKTHQNRWKIYAKRHFMLDFKFASIFPDFYSQLGPLDPWKSLIFQKENNFFFEKRPLEVNSDFGSMLEANMPPKSIQNPPKSE